MRKKLAGIYLNAPLTETEISGLGRNLDREITINSTIVSDAMIDTLEMTNYILTFKYDTTADGGTNIIRRSIPTLELLGNNDVNLSGTHWTKVATKTYHYITSGTRLQQALEELDTELAKRAVLKHIIDAVGDGSLVSSSDALTPDSTVDDGDYLIALGNEHSITYATNSVILGGYQSIIEGDNDADESVGDIGDTDGYTIQYASVIGGYRNYIKGNSDFGSIFGGDKNEILDDSVHGLISGGAVNKIYGHTDLSTIVGGVNSYIYGSASYQSRGGIFQSISSYIVDSTDSIILGGDGNYIVSSSQAGLFSNATAKLDNSGLSIVSGSSGTFLHSAIQCSVLSSGGPSTEWIVYNSQRSSVIASEGSYLWNNDTSAIMASEGCMIEYYENVNSIPVTTVNAGSLVLSNTTGLTIGEMVTVRVTNTLVSSAFHEYIINTIDTGTNTITLNELNGNVKIFTVSEHGTNSTSIKPLIQQSTSFTVVSNTSDTLILNAPLYFTNYTKSYVILDGYTVKRLYISGSGTTSIKLFDKATNTAISGFSINQFAGNTLRVYLDPYYINPGVAGGGQPATNVIFGSQGAIMTNSGGSSIISSGGARMYDSVGYSSIIASGGSYIHDVVMQSVILGGGGNYIHGIAKNSVIIGGSACEIYATHASSVGVDTNAVIVGSLQSNIKNSTGSVIMGGVGNHIDNFDNTILLGTQITADRENATFVNSLTITDRTMNLPTKTAAVNDVLTVEAINGDGSIATVKWGAGGGGNISIGDGMIESYNVSLWGSSTFCFSYVSVGPDTTTVYTGTSGISAALSTDGFVYDDYMTRYDYMFSSTGIPENIYNKPGIQIVANNRYVIKLPTIQCEWRGEGLNESTAPDTTLTCGDSIQIIAEPTPGNNYLISYKTSSMPSFATLVDGSSSFGTFPLENVSGSNVGSPKILGYFNKSTYMLTFISSEINQSISYAEGITGQYYTRNSDGNLIIVWPTGYDLPTVGDRAWFKGIDFVGDTLYHDYSINELLGGRLVRVGNGASPNETLRNCIVWYPNDGPEMYVNVTANVFKVSSDFYNMFP